jgi:hypothetical protein
MQKTYIIEGPENPNREGDLYWKQEENQPVIPIGEWIDDVNEATDYDRSILGPTPLPEGTTAILDWDTMDRYTLDTLPTMGLFI